MISSNTISDFPGTIDEGKTHMHTHREHTHMHTFFKI